VSWRHFCVDSENILFLYKLEENERSKEIILNKLETIGSQSAIGGFLGVTQASNLSMI
jgi:filamentous hemagglutinin family protein